MPKIKRKGKKKKSIDRKIDFDMNLPAKEARSPRLETAKKILRSKMEADLARSKGGSYRGPIREGVEVPEIQLFQDTKTGEYIAKEKLSSPAYGKGGKMKAVKTYKKGGSIKDACYHKVKKAELAAGNTWPSAYASGRLAKCRKMGSGNYGKGKK